MSHKRLWRFGDDKSEHIFAHHWCLAVFSPEDPACSNLNSCFYCMFPVGQRKKLSSHSKRTRMGRDSRPLTWNCTRRENRTGWWERPNSSWQLWSHLPHQLLSFFIFLHIKAASSHPLSVVSRSLSLLSMLIGMGRNVFALSHHPDCIWGSALL